MGGAKASVSVDVLTAEVRVLMVGARQVTLSVVKQLDQFDIYTYPLSMFVPFGRIKTGMLMDVNVYFRFEDRWEVKKQHPLHEFIGIDSDSGSLMTLLLAREDVKSMRRDSRNDELALLSQWVGLPLIVLAGLR